MRRQDKQPQGCPQPKPAPDLDQHADFKQRQPEDEQRGSKMQRRHHLRLFIPLDDC
jgi:hypothetical protein